MRDQEARAVGLTLDELVGMQVKQLRGSLKPGRRGPFGERPGRGRARSLDFDGSSPYIAGDDVRWMDWRATARSGRPYVKRFAAQSHRARMLVVDLHAALHFGTRTRLMAKTAALTAARLAWEAFALNEPVGLAVPDQDVVRPKRGRGHLLHVLDRIQNAYSVRSENIDLAQHVHKSAAFLRAGDEICVVSDFPEPWMALLQETRALAESLVLNAFVVTDHVVRSALPAGRYPVLPPGAPRRVLTVSAKQGEAVEDLMIATARTRRQNFNESGWHVVDADEIVPRADGNLR